VIAAVLERIRHIGPRTLVAAIVGGGLVLPSAAQAIGRPDRTSWSTASFIPALRRLDRLAQPGDGVVAFPAQLVFPAEWYLTGPSRPRFLSAGIPNGAGFVIGSGRWDGRRWLVEFPGYRADTPDWLPCGEAPLVIDGYRIRCFNPPPN
jgi:hypothetical protein